MEKRVRLGSVEFSVVQKETIVDSAIVTDNQVESGQDVSDHMKKESSVIEISGIIVGDDAEGRLRQLQQYQKGAELLTYIGIEVYGNVVLQTIERSRESQVSNGFVYNITLKQIRIATAKEVEISVVNPATKKASLQTNTKVKENTNNGKQQTQRKMTTPSVVQVKGLNDYKASLMAQKNRSPIDNMKSTTRIYKGTEYGGGGGKF